VQREDVMAVDASVLERFPDGPRENLERQLQALQQYVCELLIRNQQLREALHNALLGAGNSAELEP
jgi:hypothetical protein